MISEKLFKPILAFSNIIIAADNINNSNTYLGVSVIKLDLRFILKRKLLNLSKFLIMKFSLLIDLISLYPLIPASMYLY